MIVCCKYINTFFPKQINEDIYKKKTMTGPFMLSENERQRIHLMHKSYLPELPLLEHEHSFINDLMLDLKTELDFYKKILLNRISVMEIEEKQVFLTNDQNDFIKANFNHNRAIVESYNNFYKNTIVESVSDFSHKIDRFNEFVISSLLQDIKKCYVSEQLSAAVDYAGQQVSNAANYVGQKVTNVVDYVKEKGISNIMEGIRSALMSNVGQLIQTSLAIFTGGAGAIANDVVWGIMTLYDAFQHFVNKAAGSLANLVIDVINLVAGGTLGKALSGFKGAASTSIGEFLKKIMNSPVGKLIQPIVDLFGSAASKVASLLKSANDFMVKNMKITWVSNLITSVQKFFGEVAVSIKQLFAQGAAKAGVATAIQRAGVTLSGKFNSQVFASIAQMSEQQIANQFGKTVAKGTLKAAQDYAEKYLKEKPIEYALAELDKKFGTVYGDIYALYEQGGKAAKKRRGLTGVGVTADILQGKNPLNKLSKAKPLEKVGKAVSNIEATGALEKQNTPIAVDNTTLKKEKVA